MKKQLAILLAILLLTGLCACSRTPTNEESSTEDNPTAESAGTVTPHETPSGEKLSGMLRVIWANGEQSSNTFSFYGGTVTPERIAAGLSGWTGLRFRISCETDEAAGTIRINWLPDSSFATGQIPDGLREEFTFTDAETMRWFMLNSLTGSILENLGDYAVYYTVDGKDIAETGLSASLSSDKAYTETDDSHILLK